MTPTGSGNLTFKWLVGILMVVLFAAGSGLIADTRTNIKETKTEVLTVAKVNQEKIECLQREKLDKDLYYRDMREIKSSLEKINDKLDNLRVRK
jgi:hypothetical protein